MKDKENTWTPDVLISVPLQNKDRRDTSKSYNFHNVIKYFSKQFKEVDSLVFNSDMSKFMEKYIKNTQKEKEERNKQKIEETYLNDVSGINIGNDKNNTYGNINLNTNTEYNNMMTKEQLNLFFDLSNNSSNPLILNLKEFKDSIKYIMDIKVLIEIKDKVFENNKSPNENRRSIYFRPEFIVKYASKFLTKQNEKENETAEENFKRNLKKFLLIDNDNNTQNIQNIHTMTKYYKDSHISFFINCLDTLYFKPYDSETLTEAFHSYGVNIFYLGYVAELTSVPHVRELCMIEMIGRTCKKLLYDIMAYKYIEKANEEYYLGQNDHLKSAYDFSESNQNDPYLQFVPVTFFVRYHKEYLKKVHILSSNSKEFIAEYTEEQNRDRKRGIRGLYRQFWYRYDNYKDKEMKAFFNGSKSDEKGGKLEKNILANEIANFLKVLFNFEGDKYEVEILGQKYKNSTLWSMIIEKIKVYYMTDSKEIFDYCEPSYISLPALFNSIQYHTGITFTINIMNNTKFSNKDLINRDFTEDNIGEIKPKIDTYKFRSFYTKTHVADTTKNNYGLIKYDEEDEYQHQKVLLRYFTEKFQKNVSTYTSCYLHYMNLFREMEMRNNDFNIREYLMKSDHEVKDKLKDLLSLDYYKGMLYFL